MKYDLYKDLKSSDDFCLFDFISIGKNGFVRKRIEFTATAVPNIFNLAFGDVDEQGEIDDCIKSGNGDRNKVLATVAFAVDLFLSKYPERWIYFIGSTPERTRLYRMAIGLNFEELCLRFEINSVHENGISPFRKNTEMVALLVKKK